MDSRTLSAPTFLCDPPRLRRPGWASESKSDAAEPSAGESVLTDALSDILGLSSRVPAWASRDPQTGTYTVFIDVPGRRAEDFSVEVEGSAADSGGKLIILAIPRSKSGAVDRAKLDLHLELPPNTDQDQISTYYEAGVLVVAVPQRPASPSPRHVVRVEAR